MRKTIFILALTLLSMSSITSMAQTSTIASFQGNQPDYSVTTNADSTGAMLADGVDTLEIKGGEGMPSMEFIAWILALLLGGPTSIVAYCRAWILRRRGNSCIRCRRALQLASFLILATGIILLVIRVAGNLSALDMREDDAASLASLHLGIAMALKLFAISLIAATVGMVAILLLPFDKKTT